MAHITLSIPDSVYHRLKRHGEVKWSEVARRSLLEHLDEVEGRTSSAHLRRSLRPETLDLLQRTPEAKARAFHRAVREAEWKRTKSLTRTS